MNVNQRAEAFAKLGNTIRKSLADAEFETILLKAQAENGWFIPQYSRKALSAIADEFLDTAKLAEWVSHYKIPDTNSPKSIGLVLAGNIPLAGWHDVQCVLMAGHKALIKLSSKDAILMKWMLEKLAEAEPEFATRFEIVEQLRNMDAVIATGSGNTARYFEYYFGKYRHIIRRNRTSVALLTGKESHEELEGLAHDVFDYFGLGCRSISKLFLPQGYDVAPLFETLRPLGEQAFQNNKYRNNYDYHKSILLLNRDEHLDGGYLLLKKESSPASPVAALHYEEYDSITDAAAAINTLGERIQCVVAQPGIIEGAIPFGTAQRPALADYPDNVDTMEFLLSV